MERYEHTLQIDVRGPISFDMGHYALAAAVQARIIAAADPRGRGIEIAKRCRQRRRFAFWVLLLLWLLLLLAAHSPFLDDGSSIFVVFVVRRRIVHERHWTRNGDSRRKRLSISVVILGAFSRGCTVWLAVPADPGAFHVRLWFLGAPDLAASLRLPCGFPCERKRTTSFSTDSSSAFDSQDMNGKARA